MFLICINLYSHEIYAAISGPNLTGENEYLQSFSLYPSLLNTLFCYSDSLQQFKYLSKILQSFELQVYDLQIQLAYNI